MARAAWIGIEQNLALFENLGEAADMQSTSILVADSVYNLLSLLSNVPYAWALPPYLQPQQSAAHQGWGISAAQVLLVCCSHFCFE